MSSESRRRLARLLRDPAADLAEAALLVCAEIHPDLEVGAELLRLDALADRLVTDGFEPSGGEADARALGAYLHGQLGFDGEREAYYDPRNALLTSVLDRRRGLPITLSIVYVAVARRAGLDAFGIALPGHFVAGLAADPRPVVLDPFNGGQVLDGQQMAERVAATTGGRIAFDAAMLRPAPAAAVVRRILNNLTRDFASQGDLEDALWTVELKELLPGAVAGDRRDRGRLLLRLGRYRQAARALEAYLDRASDPADREEVARLARQCRAAMN